MQERERERRVVHRRAGKVPVRKTDGRRWLSTRTIAVVTAVCLALIAVPIVGWALPITPSYDWYVGHAGSESDPYVIDSETDCAGFIELVNGTADTDGDGSAEPADAFDGDLVQLAANLNFKSQEIVPAGGQNGTTFNGTLDGQGHSIGGFSLVPTEGATANIGLVGAAGEGSLIKNVKVETGSSLTLSLGSESDPTLDNDRAIENVGMLVGYSAGSIENCTNEGSVTVSHGMDQTKTIVFPIKNVGGLAGVCLGNVTGCANAGTVSVSESGVPYKAAASETDWDDQSILVLNVGGVVGCAGALDSSVDKDAGMAHGVIADCVNTAKIAVETPQTNGLDRFGNVMYSTSSNVGGIAGYSRASISSCSNSGYLRASHSSGIAGIVGSLRAATTTSSYSGNFTQEGTDDGMVEGAGVIAVSDCDNAGDVLGYAFSAGIVGRSGTNTTIEGCLNDKDVFILATRSTKPFPSGIVGSSYGTVAYCANLGTVISGSWNDEAKKTYKTSGGYYASGIAGNLSYFTKDDGSGTQMRISPLPELYGCYNAGSIQAIDNMRQRALVGDNSGYVHDNVAVKGLVYNDRLVYGMYGDDTESSGGTTSNNVLVSADELKSNTVIATDQTPADTVVAEGSTALGILNANADRDDWQPYWAKSNGSVNSAYPVLDRQIAWDQTDISNATVELVANAQYTGLDAVPSLRVTLGDGKTVLQQGVDFRVIPQEGATEITAVGDTPYKATVVGIGGYTGTADMTASYGIDKGELSDCTVLVDTVVFNWKAQVPAASGVHVYNLAGAEIDSSEYAFEIDPNDENLSFVDENDEATDVDTGKKGAVNVAKYKVMLTAAESDGAHFVGSASGLFTIKTAKIVWDENEEKLKRNAYPESLVYDGTAMQGDKTYAAGESIPWDSMTMRSDLPTDQQHDGLVTFAYTGHSVKPTVESVVYKDKQLVEGRDYRVVYGADLSDGGSAATESGEENLGVVGGEGYGYVMVRYVSGGNFSNYDNMEFLIKDTGSKVDLKDTAIKGTDEEIIFEEGDPYTPVQVWYGGSQLVEGTDYTIAYTDNDKVGTASFVITAVEGSAFTGSKSGTFKIVEGVPYGFTWTVDEESGTASIAGATYNGCRDAFDMVIPSTVEQDGKTYTVTSIADKAFGGTKLADISESARKIRSVTIPATVTEIGEYAFGTNSTATNLSNIKTVTFADGLQLKSIGKGAFRTTGLTEIVIPEKVESISADVFRGTSLERVAFKSVSADIPNIDEKAFYACRNVEASGYDEATKAKTFVQSTMKGNGWTWKSLGSAPVVETFTVAFDSLGGSAVSAQEVVKDGVAMRPTPDPTKDGYTFGDWYLSEDGGVTLAAEAYDFSTPVTGAFTLYAKWVESGSGPVEPEPAALVVKVRTGGGEASVVGSFTASGLAEMAADYEEPVSGQYCKGGAWTVWTATSYVPFADLFEAAGLGADWKSGAAVAYEGKGGSENLHSFDKLAGCKFYPATGAASGDEDTSGAVASTGVLALEGASSAVSTTAAAAAEANAAAAAPCSVPVFGNTEADYLAGGSGMQFWTGVAEITLVKPEPIEVTNVAGSEGVYGYEAGTLSVSVTAQFADGVVSPSYQWYSCNADGTAGVPVGGATADAFYQIPVGYNAGSYHFYCEVSASMMEEVSDEQVAVSATSGVVTVTVAKAASEIAAPEKESASSNSIVVKPVVPTKGDGEVLYAISKTNEAPETGWQSSTAFTGLDDETAYYVFTRVSEGTNYKAQTSSSTKIETMPIGVVENPVLAGRTYDSEATLADVELPAGWAWDDESVTPTVKVRGYAATFTPTDADAVDYTQVEGYDAKTGTVKRSVALTIGKATPIILVAPSASGISFGQALAGSVLSDGQASVPGEFSWTDGTVRPAVADSDTTEYGVTFMPSDADNYTAAATKAKLSVAAKNVENADVSISVPDQTYTGDPLMPDATVVVDGVTLTAGVDYGLQDYKNNIEPGTASFTTVFKGNYTGTKEGTFAIKAAPVPGDDEKPSAGEDEPSADPGVDGSGQGANGSGGSAGSNGSGGANASNGSNSSDNVLAGTGDAFALLIPAVCGVVAIAAAVLALSLSRRKDQRF